MREQKLELEVEVKPLNLNVDTETLKPRRRASSGESSISSPKNRSRLLTDCFK
jgi:hypothetical protein